MQVLETPLDFFLYFFTEELFEHIVNETNKYATQKDPSTTFRCTVTNLKNFIGIALYSSVVHISNTRNYWKVSIGQETVQNALSRHVFQRIKKYLHFNDNEENERIPADQRNRLAKIRPLFDAILRRFQTVPPPEMLSLDEQICATKHLTYLKQYMPKKKTRMGL